MFLAAFTSAWSSFSQWGRYLFDHLLPLTLLGLLEPLCGHNGAVVLRPSHGLSSCIRQGHEQQQVLIPWRPEMVSTQFCELVKEGAHDEERGFRAGLRPFRFQPNKSLQALQFGPGVVYYDGTYLLTLPSAIHQIERDTQSGSLG